MSKSNTGKDRYNLEFFYTGQIKIRKIRKSARITNKMRAFVNFV